jgi:YHS domain-containing protein
MLRSWLKRNHVKIAGLVVFSAVLITGGLVLAAEPATGAPEKTKEDSYPLETCVVTGAKLGSMGEPVIYEHEGREVRFCCKGCIKEFDEEPGEYMKIIDKARDDRDARHATRPYPLDTCLVSGGKLGSMGEPVTYLYEGQEIRLCCAGCIPRFEKDPAKYMKKLIPVEADRAGE